MLGFSEESTSQAECRPGPSSIPQKSEEIVNDGTIENRSIVACYRPVFDCIVSLVTGALPREMALHLTALESNYRQIERMGPSGEKTNGG